jgi:hypothetical protein
MVIFMFRKCHVLIGFRQRVVVNFLGDYIQAFMRSRRSCLGNSSSHGQDVVHQKFHEQLTRDPYGGW